jgi:formiminotetrahydrofolate cyclodeaminase
VEDGAERFEDLTLDAFISRLATAAPVPGGGSAAAVAASIAAGLVAMVAALTEGRERYAGHAPLAAHWIGAGRELAHRCLRLADDDAAAYGRFAAAMKMPRDSDEEREERAEALRAAARVAAEVPLRCVETCVEIVRGSEALAGRSNVNAASDLVVAALLAEAAARGAAVNVLVNLPALGDDQLAGEFSARVDDRLAEVERLAVATRETVRRGDTRAPVSGPA